MNAQRIGYHMAAPIVGVIKAIHWITDLVTKPRSSKGSKYYAKRAALGRAETRRALAALDAAKN